MAGVDHLALTAGGTGYTSAPTVTISGDGSGATATASVTAGVVTALTLTAAGSGYTYATVAFSGGAGSGARAVAWLLAPYATPDQFRAYLLDVTPTIASDAALYDVLDRATGLCNDSSVGLGFAFAGYTTEARIVRATYGPYLWLPPHRFGSIGAVALNGTPLVLNTDYRVLLSDDGRRDYLARLYAIGQTGITRDYLSNWRGHEYTVTAAWGFGDPPPSVVEVCLETAVNLWQSRKAGRFTNVVGPTDGGAIGYEGALTPLQRSALAGVKAQYLPDPVLA